MSMNESFDPTEGLDEQQKPEPDDEQETELETEIDRAEDPNASPVRHDEDDAGVGPAFRRPQVGDKLTPEQLRDES
jgi:hypothetical protein